MTDLLKEFNEIHLAINEMQQRHHRELALLRACQVENRAKLGELLSGFSVGDMLIDYRGWKARLLDVYSFNGAIWNARVINIRKDGTEGAIRHTTAADGWRKIDINKEDAA